jgi:hypothetical protein
MNNAEDLRQDAASLYRLIERISESCNLDLGPQSYDLPAVEFLTYISRLANVTLEYLDRFADGIPVDPTLYHIYRQKLWDLRSGWSILHNFTKPTADADTLHEPLSFVQWLTRRLNTVKGFEAARFVVFHTSEVNYLHLNTSAVRDLTGRLSSLIPGAQSFPTDLGLIGIPYSEGSTLFINCLIPHEMGHYVYQETKASDLLLPSLGTSISNILIPKIATVTPSDAKWCVERLQGWAQELFCDLFAIWMIGPAYSYAYVEIFDLPRILSPDGKALNLECEFNTSHPSHLFRLQQQIALLKSLGWWPHVEKINSHYSDVLQCIDSIDEAKFTFTRSDNPGRAADALAGFLLLCPHIHRAVSSILGGLSSGLGAFEEHEANIREYLSWAVVPSTIVRDGLTYHPDPLAIVNASYGLYLESLNGLVNRIENQDPTSVRTKGQWIERLELWTAKAIEDNGLLVRQQRVI